MSAPFRLTHLPVLCGAQLGALDLKLYLHQLDGSGEAGRQLPPGVLRMLKSRACRSALMFGDALAPERCMALLTDLQGTRLCFVCAHGRPTMVPLTDLEALLALQQQRQRAGGLQQQGFTTKAPSGGSGADSIRHSGAHFAGSDAVVGSAQGATMPGAGRRLSVARLTAQLAAHKAEGGAGG